MPIQDMMKRSLNGGAEPAQDAENSCECGSTPATRKTAIVSARNGASVSSTLDTTRSCFLTGAERLLGEIFIAEGAMVTQRYAK